MKSTMPARHAMYLAEAMLAAVSKDEVTPVLTGAHLTRHGHALRATTTDRYRVHEVTLDSARTTGRKGESVLIHWSALVWLIRTIRMIAPRRQADDATVTIHTKTADLITTVTITIDTADHETAILTTRAIKGNFPTVDRLIEAAEKAEPYTGPVALNATMLGKLEALNPSQYPAGRFHHTAHPEIKDRPGPVLVTYEGQHVRARGLLQPNLLRR